MYYPKENKLSKQRINVCAILSFFIKNESHYVGQDLATDILMDNE